MKQLIGLGQSSLLLEGFREVYATNMFHQLSHPFFSTAGVPDLGYKYSQGYICLFNGVHLRLAIEEKIYLHTICFQISVHISVNFILRSRYMHIVKYTYD